MIYLRKRAALSIAVFALLTTGLAGAASAVTGILTATVSPNTVSAGTTVDFSVMFNNNSSETTIGSINARIGGFSLLSASSPQGSATVGNNTARFRNLSFGPGSTLTVGIEATAPCAAGRYNMNAGAKESANGSGTVIARTSRHITVTGGCDLAFQTQPNDANVGEKITGTAFDPTGPDVTVALVDGVGNVVPVSSGSVTVSIGTNPTGGGLHGTLTRPIVNGIATFDDLSIDLHGVGYTLDATSGVAVTTSNPFTIADAGSSCSTGCTTSSTAPDGTEASMTTSSGGESFLIWGIDSLDCPGYIETTDVLTFGSTSDGTKLVSLTVPGGESEASLDVCFGTDGETTFVDKNGNHVTVGLLPDCSAVDGVPPCVVSRQHNEDYSITVTFIVPDGDPKGRL